MNFLLSSLCVTFIFLPETEGRTLEEIELFFSDNKRKMIDRHIKKADTGMALKPTQKRTISNDQEEFSGFENKAFDGNTTS